MREYLAWALAWLSTAFAPRAVRREYQERIEDAWLRTFRPPAPLRPAPKYPTTREEDSR